MTDQELARLIRDGKISATDANKASNQLGGIVANPNTQGTKVLWEQNPTTGNYYEMDVSTGGALGGEYDKPFGNPIAQPAPQTDPYASIMSEYQAQINALASETDPDFNENLDQVSPEELEEQIL